MCHVIAMQSVLTNAFGREQRCDDYINTDAHELKCGELISNQRYSTLFPKMLPYLEFNIIHEDGKACSNEETSYGENYVHADTDIQTNMVTVEDCIFEYHTKLSNLRDISFISPYVAHKKVKTNSKFDEAELNDTSGHRPL